MPEYLAPAVFVEETSFRSKSIEGVSTSTAAFVGLTSRGAVTTADGNAPPLLTSFANFERLYGGFEDLQFSTGPKVNYLAHAARAFYDNGGGRLYVARILGAGAAAAKSFVHDNTTPDPRVFFEARNPGGAVFADARKTNLRVTLRLDEQPTTLRLAQLQPPGALIKVVGAAGSAPSYFFLDANSTRLFGDAAFPGDPTTPVQVVTLSAVVEDPSGHNVDYAGLGLHPSHPRAAHLVFGDKPPRPADALGNPVKLSVQNFNPAADTKLIWDALVGSAFALWGQIGPKRAEWGTAEAEAVTADATAAAAPGDNARKDAAIAKRGVAADKLGALLAALAASLNSSAVASMQHDLAAAAKEAKDAEDKAALAGAPQADKDAAVQKRAAANDKAKALAATLTTTLNDAAIKDALTNPPQSRRFDLIGGSDGTAPPSIEAYKDALKKLGALEDISIIASPGAADLAATSADGDKHSAAVNGALVIAAEAQRSYRIAVLDTPPDKDIGEVRAIKGLIDSKYAALYYPWVIAPNPLAGVDPAAPGEIPLPPSGHVCGIYARTDIERGVWKAPANETILGISRLQRDISFGEQEVLNPLGVNCMRQLPNRGIRVWGARTTSSDPEWKYVNIRRFFLYLESSIDRGSQWAVFEPNGERLWANVRDMVSDFLYNEWINGALLGTTPKEAFFVRCDRSTMTQNDLDNGRLICLIGVAAIKPAEFVIFRIGQKTADSRG